MHRLQAAIFGLALTLSACGGAKDSRPNILLITLDTTRADHFGCYGDDRGLTPNFDALAKEGVVFGLAQSVAAVTPVSHASILTGLYQYGHGLRVISADGGFRLPETVPSIASIFRDEGWTTAAVHSAFPVSAYFGLDQGFDIFESFDSAMNTSGTKHTWDTKQNQRRSDDTTDLVLETLEKIGDDPFFMWVHYWDPHDGIMKPPNDYLRSFAGPRGGVPRSKLYGAEVSYMDQQFGRLIEHLRQTGQLENTIVVVTSDHGEGLGDHQWHSHRILYQEQIHVPLILSGPGLPSGERVEGVVSTVDIAPTLLELCGLEAYGEVHGLSLLETHAGTSPSGRFVYSDQINGFDKNAGMLAKRPKEDFVHCVTDGEWKVLYRPNFPDDSELYHLAVDPDEARNLWDTESEVRIRLLDELARRDGWVTEKFEPIGGMTAAQRTAASSALNELGYTGSKDDGGNTSFKGDVDDWRWTCPQHPELLMPYDQKHACPDCGRAPILRSRPADEDL